MLLLFKTPTRAASEVYPPIPDPWALSSAAAVHVSLLPRQVPLDPSHELFGTPIPEALMPAGLPGALQLSAPVSRPSTIAILLGDELKLGTQANEPLRHEIQAAIAWLELAALSPIDSN